MARNHANNGRVYRAVIRRVFDDGREGTATFGPYDSKAPAKGLITSAEGEARRSRRRYSDPKSAHDAVGHIESAEVVWMKEVP